MVIPVIHLRTKPAATEPAATTAGGEAQGPRAARPLSSLEQRKPRRERCCNRAGYFASKVRGNSADLDLPIFYSAIATRNSAAELRVCPLCYGKL